MYYKSFRTEFPVVAHSSVLAMCAFGRCRQWIVHCRQNYKPLCSNPPIACLDCKSRLMERPTMANRHSEPCPKGLALKVSYARGVPITCNTPAVLETWQPRSTSTYNIGRHNPSFDEYIASAHSEAVSLVCISDHSEVLKVVSHYVTNPCQCPIQLPQDAGWPVTTLLLYLMVLRGSLLAGRLLPKFQA